MMTLQEALDTELSPDRIMGMTPNELANKLVYDYKVFNSISDFNRMVIEGIQKAVNDDDEFPIKYYDKDEEMPEESKHVDPGPALTDEYIESELK